MSDEDQLKEQKQASTKWKCPECGNKLTTYIALTSPPACRNPEKHPKKTVVMVIP